MPGKRIAVMQAPGPVTGELADASAPIILPAPRANDAWGQPGGEPNNAPGNLAFGGAANVVWSADAGSGSGNVGRITASPIVYNGHVFTLDADGTVSAFANTGGSAVWRVSLTAAARKRAAVGTRSAATVAAAVTAAALPSTAADFTRRPATATSLRSIRRTARRSGRSSSRRRCAPRRPPSAIAFSSSRSMAGSSVLPAPTAASSGRYADCRSRRASSTTPALQSTATSSSCRILPAISSP